MENGHFPGRLRPDWGNTTLAAMAGLGSIGLRYPSCFKAYNPREEKRRVTKSL